MADLLSDVQEEMLLRSIERLKAERAQIDRELNKNRGYLHELREARKTPEQKQAQFVAYAQALDDSIAAETAPRA